MVEELGGGRAPMALALGSFRGESARVMGTEGEGERGVRELGGFVVTQGCAWLWPWGRRWRTDATGWPCDGRCLRPVGHDSQPKPAISSPSTD
jgi:hypothetical protein